MKFKNIKHYEIFKHQNGHYGKEYAKSICEDNIIHVYGSIRPSVHIYSGMHLPGEKSVLSCYAGGIPVRVFNEKFSDGSDAVYDATYRWVLANEMAKGIEVIGEKKQLELIDHPRINKAKNLLQSAKQILVLGFGFDRSNTELLNLKNIGGHGKRIFYTNYSGQNSLKEEASILFGSESQEYQSNVLNVFQKHFSL